MRKKKEVIIETPEKIRFSHQIAEFGTRIAAYVIDQLLQLIIAALLIWPMIGYSVSLTAPKMTYLTAAFLLIILFLMRWFYFVLFELIMEGQSPGKKMMRIRVIRDNGDSLDFETIVFRNFLRIIDGFPIVPLLGGFIALIDPLSRRLGDMVANTIVVKDMHHRLRLPDFEVNLNRLQEDREALLIKQRLSENELYIIRRFLNEYHKLPAAKGAELARNLADQVRKKLGIETEGGDSLLFLERVYHQHGVDHQE